MGRAEVLDQVRKILQTEFALEEHLIVPEARLREDLDLDSLDAVVLATHLEDATGLVLEEDRFQEIRTVRDLTEVVEELLAREHARIARS